MCEFFEPRLAFEVDFPRLVYTSNAEPGQGCILAAQELDRRGAAKLHEIKSSCRELPFCPVHYHVKLVRFEERFHWVCESDGDDLLEVSSTIEEVESVESGLNALVKAMSPILEDIPWRAPGTFTGPEHRYQSLPTPRWRRLNDGVSPLPAAHDFSIKDDLRIKEAWENWDLLQKKTYEHVNPPARDDSCFLTAADLYSRPLSDPLNPFSKK